MEVGIKRPENIDIEKRSLFAKFKLFFKNDYFKNKSNDWLLILGIAANLVDWVILAVFIRPTANKIILHYNVYFGVDAMGNWKSVFILPAVGLILLLANFFLSLHFYRSKEQIASYILLTAALMSQLSLLIASLSVIIINY
jgi:hypothetical protein